MSIAAVPAYLGNDFKEASPGMRFGQLLPIWTDRRDQETDVRDRVNKKSHEGKEVAHRLEQQGMDATIAYLRALERNRLPGLWEKNDFAARKAWDKIKALTKNDQDCMKALADRHQALANAVPGETLLPLDALATAPFTTGLGNEHPLENGFAFLSPYGLPYLPGSGVKGVLRQAARELASGDWGEKHGWDEEVPHPKSPSARVAGGSGLSVIDILFGLESKDGDTDHLRGVLNFWDVIPQVRGDSFMVEIMTPHQSHYYQWKKDQHGNPIEVAPHDSGQPNPISFLTVPPGSRFTFHVVCDLAQLRRLAPELAENGRWRTLLQAAFQHAFTWLGFGAKTAVGYGAMTLRDGRTPKDRGKSAAVPENTEETWQGVTLRWEPGPQRLRAEAKGKPTAVTEGKAAQDFFTAMPEPLAAKLKKSKELKNVTVRVQQSSNSRRLLAFCQKPG